MGQTYQLLKLNENEAVKIHVGSLCRSWLEKGHSPKKWKFEVLDSLIILGFQHVVPYFPLNCVGNPIM